MAHQPYLDSAEAAEKAGQTPGMAGSGEARETTAEAANAGAAEKEDGRSDLAPFTRSVIEVIRAIPEGRVMSYGQVAAAAGSPRGARQVVRILHTLSRKYALPWQRIVNIRGEIALDETGGGSEQRDLLEAEGVEFGLGGRIDLGRFRHEPAGEREAEG